MVSRMLEMKPVILSLLNAAGHLSNPLTMMNILVSAMVSKSSIIHDIWEPEEAELYGEHSFLHLWLRPEQVMTTNVGDAQIAVCIFIPDLPSFNPCLALGFAMINFVKNYGKEGIILSIAFEVNSFGAYAILLLGEGFESSYDEAKWKAKESPDTYGDVCHGAPMTVLPENNRAVRSFFQDWILILRIYTHLCLMGCR
ncbi:hypothetical protein EV421DRAFT_1735277 [Armillaria borealis]|uniref:Uncharacterized protein n=1 Tax=Armillaria borealis TaxID=47425 RepID=A0AA39JKV9_9AGAR|nr:hypothetical protein EV421DRAFT_1735277 [Armillaria borealis]